MHKSDSIKSAKFNVVEVCHTYGYGPPQALAEFIKENMENFLYIGLPLSYSIDQRPTITRFHRGSLLNKSHRNIIRAPEILLFLRDFLLTFTIIMRTKEKFDIFIGVNCLNTFTGLILQKIKRVKIVVFYGIDYLPNRFANPILNLFYHFLDIIASRGADSIWNLSPVMGNTRKRLNIDPKKNITVPTGAHFAKIQRVSTDSLKRKTLVWSGRMEPWSGLDMIVNSLPQILAKVPDLKVVLIGDGPMMKYVLKRSKELKLQDHLELTGWVHHNKVLEIVPKLGVAVALLSPDPINYYTDMIKIKEYLACGCPIIMTAIPNIAQEIRDKEAGISIQYESEEFVQAVVKLMSDDDYFKRCRLNALKLGEKYDWTKIFTNAFRNTLKLKSYKQNNKKGEKERIA